MPTLSTFIAIPALRSNINFRDDLLRKLSEVTLLQRAINKARLLSVDNNVILFTDLEEASLVGERNGLSVLEPRKEITSHCAQLLEAIIEQCPSHVETIRVIVLSPYSPLLKLETIQRASAALAEDGTDRLLIPVRDTRMPPDRRLMTGVKEDLFAFQKNIDLVESTAFSILQVSSRGPFLDTSFFVKYWPIEEDTIEIFSQQDWWACEKLLDRRRIIFRVVGTPAVGMGHIYRALALAHELVNYEIIFATGEQDEVAVKQLAGYDYDLHVFKQEDIVNGIGKLKPDLVINDILNTTAGDVAPFVEKGIRVINFEDLGAGASGADLTINELYDTPQIEGKNILWGRNYFFLRDEFLDACPQRFNEELASILIVFGGTDQHDLSRKIFHHVKELCLRSRIHIYIVTGPGYQGYHSLAEQLAGEDLVSITHATGVISKIMEKVQVAITSNGRTVYELAHMNIPAIVVPLHDREKTHDFASEKNGFIPMDTYQPGFTERQIYRALENLIDDSSARRKLFNSVEKIKFEGNKRQVCQIIEDLLSQELNAESI
jgi:spore coat polysaccharide biosynthesis predicted glycosyltransferase SpsG